AVQELRKSEKLDPSDLITLTLHTDNEGKDLVQTFEGELKKVALVKEIIFADVSGTTVELEGITFVFTLKR
ncbi:MAG: hypothetical protein WAZ40_02965, partial [Minisyncoccia bacterium]